MAVLDRVSDHFGPDGPVIPEVDAPIDDVLGLLTVPRRRVAITLVAESDDPLTRRELANEIAARECEKPIAQVTSKEYKRVYVGLYQHHLPDLTEVGVIETIDDQVYPTAKTADYAQLTRALEDALGGDE